MSMGTENFDTYQKNELPYMFINRKRDMFLHISSLGADGRNRTGMGGLVPQDFKSCASTSFATSAFVF